MRQLVQYETEEALSPGVRRLRDGTAHDLPRTKSPGFAEYHGLGGEYSSR